MNTINAPMDPNHSTTGSVDKGLMARETLAKKANPIKVAGSYVKFYVIAVGLMMTIVLSIYGYSTHTVKGYSYNRNCLVPTASGVEVFGNRTYHNKSLNVFGMTFINASMADEQTRLLSTHKEVGVVGIKGNEYWSMYNPAAEPRDMILRPADTYVFTQDGKAYVSSYSDFCK